MKDLEMNLKKMKAKFVYEAIGDVLKGKSEEEFLSSVEKSNLNSDDLLVQSVKVGSLIGVKKALEMGANVHDIYDFALRWASVKNYLDIVEFLLKNEANVHAVNDEALRLASEKGHLDIVELLRKNGADIHAVNDEALRHASVNGHLNVVEFLLKNGADVHAQDNLALRGASYNSRLDIVELLKKYM
jgi:hypothetical protein